MDIDILLEQFIDVCPTAHLTFIYYIHRHGVRMFTGIDSCTSHLTKRCIHAVIQATLVCDTLDIILIFFSMYIVVDLLLQTTCFIHLCFVLLNSWKL